MSKSYLHSIIFQTCGDGLYVFVYMASVDTKKIYNAVAYHSLEIIQNVHKK